MKTSSTIEQARLNKLRRDTPLFRGWVNYMLGSPDPLPASPGAEPRLSPQAFLVEQEPDLELRSHFHLTAQFQVVVAGGGMLGRHEVKPVTVHYAAPQSGYGPLISGAEGLSYFTIRAQNDTGIWALPDDKAQLDYPMTRFHGWSEHVPVLEAAALRGLPEPSTEEVMQRVADGSGAAVATLPPEAVFTPARDADCGHQFYLVLAGAITFDGKSLGRHCVGFASADEAVQFKAGEDGAQVLILSFGEGAILSPHPVKERAVATS